MPAPGHLAAVCRVEATTLGLLPPMWVPARVPAWQVGIQTSCLLLLQRSQAAWQRREMSRLPLQGSLALAAMLPALLMALLMLTVTTASVALTAAVGATLESVQMRPTQWTQLQALLLLLQQAAWGMTSAAAQQTPMPSSQAARTVTAAPWLLVLMQLLLTLLQLQEPLASLRRPPAAPGKAPAALQLRVPLMQPPRAAATPIVLLQVLWTAMCAAQAPWSALHLTQQLVVLVAAPAMSALASGLMMAGMVQQGLTPVWPGLTPVQMRAPQA